MHSKTRPSQTTLVLGVIFILGAAVRLAPIVSLEYPLNDGGLFAQLVDDLLTNCFRLPEFTTYNQGGIPYAYPPLSFYLAASLVRLLPVSTITGVRLLPAIVSLLTFRRSICWRSPCYRTVMWQPPWLPSA
jgi:hypothetical protein